MDKFSLFIKNLKDKLFGRKREQEEKPRPSHHVYKESAPKSVKPIQPVSPESVPKTIRPIQSVSEEPTLKYEEPVQPVSKDIVTKSEKPTRTAVKPRDPYFVQIGFDFGTSFSKCICRDLMTNRAWVYLSPSSGGEELPFLIPSVVLLRDGMLNHLASCRAQYPSGGLYHVKNALVKLATEHGMTQCLLHIVTPLGNWARMHCRTLWRTVPCISSQEPSVRCESMSEIVCLISESIVMITWP